MKKKIFLLLALLPALLLVVTGCDKNNKEKNENQKETETKTAELFDEKMGIKTTFTYASGDSFENFEYDESGASKAMTFKNEKLDVEFEMYYNTMTKTSYDKSQETRSAQKYYKEYKFGKYEAYAYGEYDDGLYLNILANTDDNDDVNVLFVSIDRIDNNKDVVVADVVADKDIQTFFNSMKVEMSK